MPLAISNTSKGHTGTASLISAADNLQKTEKISDSELESLKTYLKAKNKGGTLAIRTKSDGAKEMYRMQWYHRLWYCKTGAEQQKEAVRYVQDLLSKSNKQSTTVSQALSDFVSPPNVSYKDLATRLSNTVITSISLLTQTSESLLRSQEIKQDDPTEFLKSHEIAKGKQIGQGAQGRIYSINYQGNENDYLYKEELHPYLITDPKDVISGHKFYRISGDIAAARCRLSNAVESAGFFLKIIKNPKEVQDNGVNPDFSYHYLPNTNPDQIKQDAKKLLLSYPDAEIFLSGQIMKRAPGETLSSLMQAGKVDTDPNQKPFKNIVYGLYSFLAAARPRNFVHRDIKPSNLMFDQKTGQLVVIDNTSGRHLARRGKEAPRKSDSLFSNRSTVIDGRESIRGSIARPSNRDTIGGMEGTTPAYAGPAAIDRGTIIHGSDGELDIKEKEYGAEFDCFSTAMTLLALIHKDDFARYLTKKFPNKKFPELDANQLAEEWGNDPKQYLKNYLSWIKDESNTSETAEILEQNPDLRKCLQLLFEASAAGDAGEAAFKALADNPYLKKCAEVSPQATATV